MRSKPRPSAPYKIPIYISRKYAANLVSDAIPCFVVAELSYGSATRMDFLKSRERDRRSAAQREVAVRMCNGLFGVEAAARPGVSRIYEGGKDFRQSTLRTVSARLKWAFNEMKHDCHIPFTTNESL